MNLGALIATLGVDAAGLERAKTQMRAFEAQSQASIARVNASLRTAGTAMKKFGRMASMYLTLPLALVGGAAFKMHRDFESSMTKIIGLVGVARAQVEAWSKDILRMAPELGKAPAELADALYFITSAGIRGAEAMDVLEMSAKASAVGLGETKVVADLVTSAMNAYGKANLSAAQATDILGNTVKEGKAQADALAGSMGMVLPIASYMSVSFDQVGAAIAAMTRTGTSAQTASMQLRQILNAMVKPTQQAEEALKDMGISAAELRKIIREQGLLAALMKINELTKRYGEDTVARVFPNIRALSGVLDIMGKNLEDNKKIFDSLAHSTGFLNTAFQEVAQTTEFRWNRAVARLKTSLTTLGRSVADVIIPMMERFAERIKKITEWFESLSEANKKLIVKIAALIAVVGPLSILLGTLVGNVFPALIRVGWLAIKMFNALRLAVMAHPFTALAAVVLSAAAALAIYIKKTREASEAQEEFDIITDRAMANTARQRVLLGQLFRIAEDETNALADREAAIKRLNQISPEYLGNLTLENIRTQQATKAKQDYINELLREAKVKALQEELVKIEKEIYEQVQQYGGGRLKLHQVIVAGIIKAYKGEVGAATYLRGKSAENYEQAKEELEKAQKALQEYLDTLIKVGDFDADMPDIDLGITTAAGGTGHFGGMLKEIAAITRKVREEEQALSTMTQILGDDFDEVSQRTALYENTLMELARLGLAATHPEIVKVIAKLREWQNTMTDGQEIMEHFREELALIEMKSQIFGNALEWISAKIQLYKITIEGLLAAEGDWSTEIEELAKKLNVLLGIQKELQEETVGTGEVISNVARSMMGFSNAIVSAAEDSKVSFAEAMNIISQSALATIGILEALAAANIIAKEAQKGLVGIFTAIAGLTMLAAVWAAFVKPKKMGKGNEVVPPGYPNDTYPALLTSGQEVRNPDQIERDRHELRGRLEIDGTKIYWVLEEVKEQMSRVTG